MYSRTGREGNSSLEIGSCRSTTFRSNHKLENFEWDLRNLGRRAHFSLEEFVGDIPGTPRQLCPWEFPVIENPWTRFIAGVAVSLRHATCALDTQDALSEGVFFFAQQALLTIKLDLKDGSLRMPPFSGAFGSNGVRIHNSDE